MSAFVSKKYSYRSGYSYKVSAQIVGETMEAIVKRGDQLTAQSFLDESRPVEAPTHALFEWDDSIAAEKYRLHQSKNVILLVECTEETIEVPDANTEVEVVEVSEPPKESTKFRYAVVNVNPKRPGQIANFVPIQTALSNEDMRRQVLANAIGELKSIYRRYSTLKELAAVMEEIRKLDGMEGEE